jgi:hypothetical protein
MAEGGEVDADLMGAAGVELGFDEGEAAGGLQDAVAGGGLAALGPASGHAGAAAKVAGDGQGDDVA